MTFLDIAEIRKRDRSHRPGGEDHVETAVKLHQLYDDRSRALTLATLQSLGIGDSTDKMPLEIAMLPRICAMQSVIYRMPPVRRLVRAGEELADDAPEAMALAEAYSRAQLDVILADVERLKNLFRQVVVTLAESEAHGTTVLRVYEPYNVIRDLNPAAGDTLEEDAAILLQYVCAKGDGTPDPGDRFFAWLHEDDGSWRCIQVDGTGEALPEAQQQYPNGVTPFGGVLPAMLIHDEAPRGRTWLPLAGSRLAYALHVNGLVADLKYLIKMEAHSRQVLSGASKSEVTAATGPGEMLILRDAAARLNVVAHSPQITAALSVIDQVLRLWAVSESLPDNLFSPNRTILTGTALRVQEGPLNQRRQRQAALAVDEERRLYKKFAAVHNPFAEAYGLATLDGDAHLRAVIARPWIASEPREVQQRFFAEMAIGLASAIDYIMERDGCDRAAAIATWDRVQVDRAAYPVVPSGELVAEAVVSGQMTPPQNPGAMLDDAGPRLAGVSATKTPGAMNPDPASSVDGASVTAAAQRGLNGRAA